MRLRLLAAAAATALFALPLAACAEDDDETVTEPTPEADAADRVVEAAQATLDQGTAAFTISIEHGDDGTDTDADRDLDAGVGTGPDADDDTGPGTRFPGGGDNAGVTAMDLDVEGDADFDNDQRRITLTANGDTEAVIDGTTVYVERQTTDDQTTDDQNGVAGDNGVELDDLDPTENDQNGTNGTNGQTAGQWSSAEVGDLVQGEPRAAAALMDPAALLRLIEEDQLVDVSQNGMQQNDGTNDTNGDRYSVTVDVGEATVDDDALSTLIEQMDNDNLDLTVWLDNGVVSEVQFELDATATTNDTNDATGSPGTDDGTGTAGTGQTGTATVGADGPLMITVEYSDLGEDVTIQVPDQDEVAEEADPQALRGALGLTPTTVSGPDTDGTGAATTDDEDGLGGVGNGN